jgi:hypothetical protein
MPIGLLRAVKRLLLARQSIRYTTMTDVALPLPNSISAALAKLDGEEEGISNSPGRAC